MSVPIWNLFTMNLNNNNSQCKHINIQKYQDNKWFTETSCKTGRKSGWIPEPSMESRPVWQKLSTLHYITTNAVYNW